MINKKTRNTGHRLETKNSKTIYKNYGFEKNLQRKKCSNKDTEYANSEKFWYAYYLFGPSFQVKKHIFIYHYN